MNYKLLLIINWLRYYFNINLFVKKDDDGFRQ